MDLPVAMAPLQIIGRFPVAERRQLPWSWRLRRTNRLVYRVRILRSSRMVKQNSFPALTLCRIDAPLLPVVEHRHLDLLVDSRLLVRLTWTITALHMCRVTR